MGKYVTREMNGLQIYLLYLLSSIIYVFCFSNINYTLPLSFIYVGIVLSPINLLFIKIMYRLGIGRDFILKVWFILLESIFCIFMIDFYPHIINCIPYHLVFKQLADGGCERRFIFDFYGILLQIYCILFIVILIVHFIRKTKI